RHTRSTRDWSSDVCSSDLLAAVVGIETQQHESGVAIGGGKVTVEDFLRAERGGRNVDGFFELEGQFGGGDVIDAGSDHEEAPARSEERRVGKESRERGARS